MNEDKSLRKFYRIVEKIFSKYEIYEGYYILEGLELLGFDNSKCWFTLVEEIKEKRDLGFLPYYISMMKLRGKEALKKDVLIVRNEPNHLETFEQLLGISTNKVKSKTK